MKSVLLFKLAIHLWRNLLLEACLEVVKSDALVGIQDMGAAGLTSSSAEMASKAGSGIEMNLDLSTTA